MSEEQQMAELEVLADNMDLIIAEHNRLKLENAELKEKLAKYELPYTVEVQS